MACAPELPDLPKCNIFVFPQLRIVEVVMSDCVSPVVEITKALPSDFVSSVDGDDFIPEFKSKSVEIGTQGSGGGIAGVEFSTIRKLNPNHVPQ